MALAGRISLGGVRGETNMLRRWCNVAAEAVAILRQGIVVAGQILTSGQISFGVAGLISLGSVCGADEFRWRCWQDEHVEARRWRYEQPDE